MEKKGALKLLIVFIIISLISACSKEKSDQIKLNPQRFQIFLSENSSSKSGLMWEESNIADKSKLLYDVFLNGKLQQKDRSLKKITFENLEENVEYSAKIIAKSIYKTEKEAILIFKTLLDPVPKPLEFKVETISSTYIKLRWVKTNAEDILNYDVYLNGEKIVSKLDSEEFIFSDLKSKTSYNIKIVGINKFNKSTEISKKYITTDFVDPEDFELSFSDITTTGVKLKWTISSSDDQLSSNITYKVFVNGVEKAVNLSMQSYELINLVENTKYTIEVEATNKYGRSKKKGIIIRTKEFIKAKLVSDFNVIVDVKGVEYINLHIETIGDTNAVVVYDVMIDGKSIGRFLNNDIFTCDNLSAETIYHLKITARNSCDISRIKEKQFKTLAEPTLDNFEVSSKEITNKSVLLNWTECIASDTSDVFYRVYDNNGTLLIDNLKRLEYRPEIILKPSKVYNYKIVACHINGKLIREKFVSFTTFDNPQINIQKKVIGVNSLDLEWSFDFKDGVYLNFNEYTVSINKLQVNSTVDNTYIIKNLKADTEYTVLITAKFSELYSNIEDVYTKEIIFRTKVFPSVKDYRALITSDVYHIAKLSLSDFKYENSSIFNDFSSFIYNVYIDDYLVYDGPYKEVVCFENLEANSSHLIKLIVKHKGGELVSEKQIKHTCFDNHTPTWSNKLVLESISSSYVLFNNIFANDKIDNLKVNKYRYYINNKLLTEDSNILGLGRVIRGVNDLNKRIYISNLNANSDYEFYMEAEDSHGDIIRTATIPFKTSPNISNLKVISNIDSYNIFWDKNGDITKIKDINIEVQKGLKFSMIYSKNNFILAEYNNKFILTANNIEDIDIIDKLRIVIYWKNGDVSKISLSVFYNTTKN